MTYTPPDFTEPRLNKRWGPWRRLTLLDRLDRPFLQRDGIDVGLFGVYVHRITAPDPGLDMHDHPWAFVSWVVRGGYSEVCCDARRPSVPRLRFWGRWSVHRMRQTDAHRILSVRPGTVTVVFRGRKTRPWGFYVPFEHDRHGAGHPGTPHEWVDYRDYDYATRRPVSEVRS